MSAVELAIRKVKKLSAKDARELLQWLNARTPKRSSASNRKKQWSKKEIAAWHDSIRLTSDWEFPKMPNDLVRKVDLF